MSDDRALEDALFQAQASLRQQEDDIAEILKGVAEAKELMARARAELDAEAAQSREEREEEEREARSGALGADRRDLQRRLDREETSWADVMSGRDEHPTAVAYRKQLGDMMQTVVEQESEKDPALREGLENMARYTEPGDPEVRVPDWPSAPEEVSDGRRPIDPGPGNRPPQRPGTW